MRAGLSALMADSSAAVVAIDVAGDACLRFRGGGSGPDYPTCALQKGLLLAWGGRDLDEEGIGFGVPLLRFGHETVFPGAAEVGWERGAGMSTITVDYRLDSVERLALASGRIINSGPFYWARERLSALHRNCPRVRGLIMGASNGLRRLGRLQTRFERAADAGVARVTYSIRPVEGAIHVDVDLRRVNKDGCTQVIVANEQGASYFDSYEDSDGLRLAGRAIGTWDETCAEEASVVDSRHGIRFALSRTEGARMFRGREYVAGRLAWAGLDFVISRTDLLSFNYDIRVTALK